MTNGNNPLGLVLTRQQGEMIVITDTEDGSVNPILISVTDIRESNVRLGVRADDRYGVHRDGAIRKGIERGYDLMEKIKRGERLNSQERALLDNFTYVRGTK